MARTYLSQDFIDELLARNEIVNLLSKYITLNRRGNNYWACCPFHMEKTPSFVVSQDRQLYKCFGCGEAGNSITFLMKYENMEFYQAVEYLCKQSGLEMPGIEDNQEMQEKRRVRDVMLNILNHTCKFYQDNLHNPKGQAQLNYINKRGLSQSMIDKFKIGASLDYESLPNYLKKLGYSYEEMINAGVVGKNEKGNYYDFYGTRVMFPILNGLGEVVGFSGRDISNNPEKAKYKNTSQTALFNKSNLIYGFNFLRELKRNHLLDSIILVEGQMDVIACHQAGIDSAVGCLGTALTESHAKDMSHLCKNIILCLDGDSAGATATYRAMTILRGADMNVSVVRLEGAKDPDEYIKKFGKEKFRESLENAMNYMEFILIDLAKKYNLDKPNEKNEYINEAVKYLSQLSTPSEQEIYLAVLREIVNVPVDALRRTLSGSKAPVAKLEEVDDKNLAKNNYISEAKIVVLASMLNNKLDNKIVVDDLFEEDDEYKEIYNFIQEKQKTGQTINVSSLYTIYTISPNSVWDKIINYNFPPDEVLKNFLLESINRLRMSILKIKKENLKNQLKTIQSLDEMYKIIANIKTIDETITKIEMLKNN